jgi:hypothetical protein
MESGAFHQRVRCDRVREQCYENSCGADLNKDMWRPSVCLAWCDRTQGQHPGRLTGASGGVGLSPTLSIMALFFVGAYK